MERAVSAPPRQRLRAPEMTKREPGAIIRDVVESLEHAELARRDWMAASSWEQHDLLEGWLERRKKASAAVAIAQRLASVTPGSPAPEAFEPDDDGSFDGALLSAVRLQALIETNAEFEALGRSAGPSLTLESLHSWVGEAASTFWSDGHFRSAVHAAASQIDLHLQAKLQREDVSGSALVREAFSLKDPSPREATPALRAVRRR